MHSTYYFLKNFSYELSKIIPNAILTDCFTQSKNELIFSFLSDHSEWHLMVNISRGFHAFALKSEFHKAKSKYQNVFRPCTNRKVKSVVQVPNDRAFYMVLENNFKIVFKMHGNRSNIVLIDEKDEVNAIFNPKLKGDLSLVIEELQKPAPVISVTDLEDKPNKLLPQLGKNASAYLIEKGWSTLDLKERESLLTRTHQEFESPNSFVVNHTTSPATLSLWESEGSSFLSAIEATNKLYNELNYYLNFEVKKTEVLTHLEKKIKLTKNYVTKCESELEKLLNKTSFRQKADVLMANLHLVTESNKVYKLLNFYTDKEIEVKLKTGEKPQNLASKWYSKDKNQHLEFTNLEQKIKQKQIFISELEAETEKLKAIKAVKELNQYLKRTTPNKEQKSLSTFKESHFMGYDIYIGRNSKNNDELCKFGRKDDLWLHAKDVAGSHVLIKTNTQNNTPSSVIEFAASLAAYYSKRKQDSLCPVIYTELKYVRKRKGFLPGQVSIERENVVLVKPKGLNE